MEAREYDRIADLLMQIRAKYLLLNTNDPELLKQIEYMRHYLASALALDDNLCVKDGKGLLCCLKVAITTTST